MKNNCNITCEGIELIATENLEQRLHRLYYGMTDKTSNLTVIG